MRLLVLVLLVALVPKAQAQATTPPLSRWNVGLKLGTGAGYYSDRSFDDPSTRRAHTGGLSVGYRFGLLEGRPTAQADVLLERRSARPWQPREAMNTALFVPLYLRTGQAAARVHVLLGAGPTFWLSSPSSPYGGLYAYPVEATALLGAEVRLLPLRRYETTLALTYRGGLSPSTSQGFRSIWGGINTQQDRYGWLGATLNVYFQPKAQL
jgi:hypothetical protein